MKFKNVYIVKYEELEKLNFLNKLFNISGNDLKELQEIYKKTVLRKGYRNYYTFKTNQMLNSLNKYLKFSNLLIMKKYYLF